MHHLPNLVTLLWVVAQNIMTFSCAHWEWVLVSGLFVGQRHGKLGLCADGLAQTFKHLVPGGLSSLKTQC